MKKKEISVLSALKNCLKIKFSDEFIKNLEDASEEQFLDQNGFHHMSPAGDLTQSFRFNWQEMR